MPFAVIMLLGPGEPELERMQDTLESLEAFEAGNYDLFLVDDDNDNLARQILDRLPNTIRNTATVLRNPRNGRGSGVQSGAAVGIIAGLGRASKVNRFDFFLKLDADALVIKPFSVRVKALLAASPDCGIMGCYQFSPASARGRTSAPALEKLLRQVSVWRQTEMGRPAVQMAWWGRYGQIRNLIREAVLNGYRLGEHCQGGAYVVSPECARKLFDRGILGDPLVWIQTPLGEDVVMGLCTSAIGLKLGDINQNEHLFAVKHRGLPASPERLVEHGFSVIHSVKDYADQLEENIRGYFKAARTSLAK